MEKVLLIDDEQIIFRADRSLRIRQLSCSGFRDVAFSADVHLSSRFIDQAFSAGD